MKEQRPISPAPAVLKAMKTGPPPTYRFHKTKPRLDHNALQIAITMPPPATTARRRRTRRGRARKSPAFHVSVFNCMELVVPWERDWADLPLDAISCVLHKLSLRELLLGGVAGIWRSWRHAAREEPELWRRIDVRWLPDVPGFTWHATLANMMWSALRLGSGQCHTFSGECLDDNLFMFLAKTAPLLKSLDLTRCYRITNGGFANAIKKFPLLEELDLFHCLYDEEVLQLVAKACPCLKRFRLVQQRCRYYGVKERTDDRKAFAIARMQGLRSLNLIGDNLSNKGLAAIIDNCRHLKYLSVHDCCNITMDDNLTAKCARINMDYYEYVPPPRPYRRSFSSISWITDDDDDYDYDDYHDLSLFSYLGDAIDGADFEEYERILDVKGMRRYLS